MSLGRNDGEGTGEYADGVMDWHPSPKQRLREDSDVLGRKIIMEELTDKQSERLLAQNYELPLEGSGQANGNRSECIV
jgi:hypothetical protein